MSRWLRIRDGRGRDARVRMEPARRRDRPRPRTSDGRSAAAVRFIKSPPARTYAALRSRRPDDAARSGPRRCPDDAARSGPRRCPDDAARSGPRGCPDDAARSGPRRCPDDAALAELIIEEDAEIDFEAAGRRTGPTHRVLLDPDGNVLYAAAEVEVVCDRRGVEVERRAPVDCPANVNGETPLVWTGRMLSRAEAARRLAFTRNCRLRHVDGLTYDFLFGMAEELHEADSLVLVGAGPGGRDPIILERNGLPYRGFIEGRVHDDRYLLVLHLTHLELAVPVEASP